MRRLPDLKWKVGPNLLIWLTLLNTVAILLLGIAVLLLGIAVS